MKSSTTRVWVRISAALAYDSRAAPLSLQHVPEPSLDHRMYRHCLMWSTRSAADGSRDRQEPSTGSETAPYELRESLYSYWYATRVRQADVTVSIGIG